MNFKTTIKRAKFIYFSLLLIIAGISANSFLTIKNTSKKFSEYREMAIDSNISKNLLNELMFLRMTVKNFIQTDSPKFVEAFETRLKDVETKLLKAEQAIQNPERVTLLKESEQLFQDYKDSFSKLAKFSEKKVNYQNKVNQYHLSILKEIKKTGVSSDQLSATYLEYFVMLEKNALDVESEKKTSIAKNRLIRLSESNVLTNLIQDQSDYHKNLIEQIKEGQFVTYQKLDTIGPIIAKKLTEIARSIQATQDVLGPALVKSNQVSMNNILYVSVGCLILALFGILHTLKSLNSISQTVLSISGELSGNSRRMKEITDKTKINSNRVAESSQEQAASLEETSSSLEEMDGMARRNLETVKEANLDTSKMKEISEHANQHMSSLVESMEQITNSNKKVEEISAVISDIERKTRIIDEIVSQTKILSFNASVEAERAGEHGKGFAVVAEEVGALAKTSGMAAKEIQEIVVKTLNDVDSIIVTNRERVKTGNKITEEASKILEDINQICSRVLVKNSDVVNATDEQVQGIKQINIAVSELDKATQENTSVAQETSSVASELDGQAKDLTRMVSALNKILGHSEESSSDKVKHEEVLDENIIEFSAVHRETKNLDSNESDREEKQLERKKVSNDPWDQL